MRKHLVHYLSRLIWAWALILLTGAAAHAQTPPYYAPLTVEFPSETFCVSEGGTATISVRLTGFTSQTVTVSYETSSGTASQPHDYTDVRGVLTFAPGTGPSVQTFTVPTRFDAVYDPDETVNLTLKYPPGVTPGRDKAVLKIIDVPPLLSLRAEKSAICAGAKSDALHQTEVIATLTDYAGAPLPNVQLNCSTDRGTLSATAPTTDFSGQARTVLTSNHMASDAICLYQATVKAEAGKTFAETKVKFESTVCKVTAPSDTVVFGAEPLPLTLTLTCAGQAVSGHAIGWRISRILDVDGIMVYDGTGSVPSGYGSVSGQGSSQADSKGISTAKFEAWTKPGTVEIEASDQEVEQAGDGEEPKDKKEVLLCKARITDSCAQNLSFSL